MGKYAVNVTINGNPELISKSAKVILVKNTGHENSVQNQNLAWISFKPWMKNDIIKWNCEYAMFTSSLVESNSKGAMILQNDLYREKGAGWFYEHIGPFDP